MRITNVFGIATCVAAVTPHWITPENVAEAYASALESKTRVLAMTEAELREAPAKDKTDISYRIHEAETESSLVKKFEGFTLQGSEFRDGFDTLASILGITSDEFYFCLRRISFFWKVREHWFTPSVSDIVDARGCVDLAVDMISKVDLSSHAEVAASGSFLAQLMAELSYVVYSPAAELRIRFPATAVDGLPDVEAKKNHWKFFQQYMKENVVLRHLLDEATKTISDSDLNSVVAKQSPRVTLFTEDIEDGGSSNKWLEHAGDFLDYWYSVGAIDADHAAGSAVLPYWKQLLDKTPCFDDLEYHFAIAKVEIIASPSSDVEGQAKSFRDSVGRARGAWSLTVGTFLNGMWSFATPESVTSIRGCLPEGDYAENINKHNVEFPSNMFEFYEFLNDHSMEPVVDMYRCITDGVNAGHIVVPDHEGVNKGEFVASLIHMARVATSVSAFLVNASRK